MPIVTPHIPKDSHRSAFLRWLIEPSPSLPPTEKHQARLLMAFLLVAIAAISLYQLLYLWLDPQATGTPETVIGVSALGLAYVFSRLGYLRTAVILTLTLPYLGLLAMVMTSANPLDTMNVLAFLVIPLLFSSVFFSSCGVAAVAVFYSLGLLALVFLAPPITLSDLLTGELSFLWIITGLIHVMTQHRAAIETEHQIALANSEARFRMMFEDHKVVMLLIDPASGVILDANSAAQAFYGYALAALRQMNFDELGVLPPEAAAELRQRGLDEQGNFFVLSQRLANGEVRTVEVYSTPIAIHGKLILSSIIHDITERKQVEDDLRLFKTIVEVSSEAIAISDPEGRLIYINPAHKKLFGRAPEQDQRLSYQIYYPPESAKVLEEVVVPLLSRGESWEGTLEVFDVAGRRFPLWERADSILGADGQLQFAFGLMHDITGQVQTEERLRESERKLSTLLSNLLGFAYRCRNDQNWTMEFISQACQTILGYQPEELIGNRVLAYNDLIHPGDRAQVREAIQAALEARMPFQLEYRLFTRSGAEKWVWEQGRGVFAGETLEALEGYIIDITERKQTENALHDSEEKYRSLMESSDALIIMLDRNGRVEYANDKAAQSQGRKAVEVIGKNLRELVPGEIADRYLQRTQQVLSTNGKLVFETVTGQTWYRTSILPVHDERGQAVRALVSAFDITELKTAQNNLMELNRTLEERVRLRTVEVQDLYDNAPAGYHSLNEEGVIVMINRTELNWLGYSREELLGRPIWELLTEESQAVFRNTLPEFKQIGWLKDLELDFVRKDGSLLPVLLNATASKDEKGRFLISRCTLFDISERRKSEIALRESRDELKIVNNALEKAARAKDEFLASMSHELRTPLTGILGLSEALQYNTYGTLTPKQEKALKNIEDSGQHLLALINDILDLSKIEAGQLTLQTEVCSLAEICQSSLQLTKGLAHQKEQNVSFSMTPAAILLTADPRRLKQMLVNLLSNAIKFTATGGSLGLVVEGSSEEGAVRLTVWDKGIGIRPEDQPRLFQPFVQLDSSLARQSAGTGLGLSLVLRIADLHGGSVRVESVFGEGSRFTLALPWSGQNPQPSSPVPAETSRPERAVRVGEDAVRFEAPLILIVDDNEVILHLTSDVLKTKGFRVMTSPGALEGLELASSVYPDLILMDIQMPGMDGFEATRRLRLHPDPRVAAIPILAVTALAMVGDRSRCLEAGVNEYLCKPVEFTALVARIDELLAKKNNPGRLDV
jgi:PAS domain S-box-containing protein